MKTDLKKSDGIDPRESMRVLPKWMQPLLTELTGKALPEEEAPFRWSWWMRLAVAWLLLLGSVTAGGALLTAEPIYWLLLPMTWLFTVSSLRAFQTTFVHHASHGNLSGRAWLDKVLGEIMSTVTWIVGSKRCLVPFLFQGTCFKGLVSWSSSGVQGGFERSVFVRRIQPKF